MSSKNSHSHLAFVLWLCFKCCGHAEKNTPKTGSIDRRSEWTCARLTVLEDPLHVEPVGGAGLVVGAALQVVGELPGPAVVYHPGVGRADGV